ncbi:hypothetical protein U1Q18_008606 [Sarracenia purpurea var. burkii]
MWEFSVGLYMINVSPDSLILAAVYGVVESACTALFGPFVGHWVNNLTYVKLHPTYRVVVISEGQPPEILTKMNSVIRRIDLICKLLAPVASGFIISFVSLTASASVLLLWNIVSVFFQYWLLMSVYSGIPSLREMNQKKVSRLPWMPEEENPSTSQEKRSLLSDAQIASESFENSWKRKLIERFSNICYIRAWRVYLQQDVVLPGVALALLYFTVLR